MKKKDTAPRGIRNNNPLNIRIGNTWLGEASDPGESEFEVFVHIKYGLRAAFCILRRYIRRYHRDTPTKIISAWAPSSENNTQAYINVVCKRAQLTPESVLDYFDKPTMCALVAAMAYVENGCEIDACYIEEAYDLA